MVEATIRDVARRAQVSVASVSRALNGLDIVREETRSRVLAAAAELGYVPHAGARSLSLARTNAIGVVLPDVHGEFFSEIVRGMDVAANRGGYLLLLSNLHAGAQAKTVLRAMRGRVDGLLVMAPHLDWETLEGALPATAPAVLINAPADVRNHSTLRIDNAGGVEAVVDHFAALGRRRIVHVAGPEDNLDAQERAAAFRDSIERQPPAEAVAIVAGDFTEQAGEQAVRSLLADGIRFDALFAANDMMATGALQALAGAGVRVPEDVAVAGFDDVPLARHLGLTTVRARVAELGARAVELLLATLGNHRSGPVQEVHCTELIIRRTTDPAAARDGLR